MSNFAGRLPPLPTLVPFEAAFRHRNFTRAAEELHFSQATISRRIGELEADLGAQLFERHRHDVHPTAAAEELAASIRLAFGELVSTTEAVRRRGRNQDSLRIFSDLSLAATLVAPIVGDFQRQHPDLQIRVLSSFEPVETTTEDFDLGLQYGKSGSTSLAVEPLADDNVFPVCSPGFASKLGASPTAEALRELPLLHVDYEEPSWVDWARFLAFVGAEKPPSIEGLVFTSYQVCLDVAQQGEGVALGWERTVKPRLDAGLLVRLEGLTMPQPHAIKAYRRNTQSTNPLVDEFLEALKASIPLLG